MDPGCDKWHVYSLPVNFVIKNIYWNHVFYYSYIAIIRFTGQKKYLHKNVINKKYGNAFPHYLDYCVNSYHFPHFLFKHQRSNTRNLGNRRGSLCTSNPRIKAVLPHDKLYLAVHVLIIYGLCLFIVDAPPCLSKKRID